MMSIIKILKNRYLPFLFAIPLFFSEYFYKGVLQDAVLYVTQYVNSIDSTRFLGDPAFAFGNQDSMGFFSPIFGLFIEFLGVAKGAFAYTFLMQTLWIVVFVFLIKSLLRSIKQRLWVLPVILVLTIIFANGMGFSHIFFFDYLPSYACSRSLSIVLGMAALALIFNQKKMLSLIFILIGTAIHPITAGWTLPFWMFYFFPKTKIPVAIVSALFPFSFVLHCGVFDIIPKDWIARPLELTVDESVSRYTLLLVFLGLQILRTHSAEIRRIVQSLFILTAIAFYWDLWGGYGEHLFLYQVQPWRAIWVPSLISAPLAVCCVKDSICNIVRTSSVSSYDLAMVLLLVSFFTTNNIIAVSLVAAALLVIRERSVTEKGFVATFAFVLLGGYLVQQYLTWCLQDFPAFFGFNYVEVCHLRDSFLFYLFVAVACFTVFFVQKKQFVPAILLILSVFLSRFMLLPVLPLFLYFFPKENKIKYWGGMVLIVIVIVFDGLIDVEARRSTMIDGMPWTFTWACVASIISYVTIYMTRWTSYYGIAIWILVCSIVAVISYNNHSANWLGKETVLDRYLHKPIFPQVKDRGRMLFYVSGPYIKEPRLQFMTGSYFTRAVLLGSIFNREHYRAALERSHLLYWKELRPQSDRFFTISDVIGKFANLDSLIDRVNFLCEVNEISHLVTDKISLPFAKEDSAMVNDSQMVFLYGCPR